MKIAIIGSGVAGLSAALRLSPHAHVTLLEADAWLGGHAHTVDVTLEGIQHGVDMGFLVYNLRTYPHLIALFEQLGVATSLTDMSFSVKVPSRQFEWCGSSLNSVFAQRKNLLRPSFWRMLWDILRFNRAATALIANSPVTLDSQNNQENLQSLGDYLKQNKYSRAFCDDYLLPMAGAIWSCSTQQMMAFPLLSFARFCHNHGLLQVSNRPQWRSVLGGSRGYVEKISTLLRQQGARIFTRAPVQSLRRANGHVWLTCAALNAREEAFDAVLLATHSNQALSLLSDASADERAVLGAIRYQANRVLLHTDASVLPERKLAWAAWNYESSGAEFDANPNANVSADADTMVADNAAHAAQVCVHYLINKLQVVPFTQPVVVSLNPVREPSNVLREWHTSHPVLDAGAVHAQARLPQLQGQRNTWFAGAWCGFGFHEDGLKAGYAAADSILQHLALQGAGLAATNGADKDVTQAAAHATTHTAMQVTPHGLRSPYGTL